jgi:hypothetical protein
MNESTETRGFLYNALSGPKNIRVFDLLLGYRDDTVRCVLILDSLALRLKFYVLPYA